MKSVKYLKFLGTAVVALGLTGIPMFGQMQQDPAQTPTQQDPAQAQPSQTQPDQAQSNQGMGQAQQVQTFTGTIVKDKGELVLKDTSTKTKYKLDNGDQAKQFQGKSVKVTGTLDTATNTIHVSNVELASAAY